MIKLLNKLYIRLTHLHKWKILKTHVTRAYDLNELGLKHAENQLPDFMFTTILMSCIECGEVTSRRVDGEFLQL